MKRALMLAALLLCLGGCGAVPLPPKKEGGLYSCRRCYGRGAYHCPECSGTQDDCRRLDEKTGLYVPTGPCAGTGLVKCNLCDGSGA